MPFTCFHLSFILIKCCVIERKIDIDFLKRTPGALIWTLKSALQANLALIQGHILNCMQKWHGIQRIKCINLVCFIDIYIFI